MKKEAFSAQLMTHYILGSYCGIHIDVTKNRSGGVTESGIACVWRYGYCCMLTSVAHSL